MIHAKFLIENGNSHRGAKLVANTPFQKGQILDSFADARLTPEPTYQTVQVSATEHVLVGDTLAKLNHSCAPNTYLDVERGVVIALGDIAIGDELTFFYPSTEWEMVEPFLCQCGSAACVGLIQGAKFLHPTYLAQYKFNPHIVSLLGRTFRLEPMWAVQTLQPV